MRNGSIYERQVARSGYTPRFTKLGKSCAVTAGAGPSWRSISTRQVWALQPWLNLLAPVSSVSALGFPCFSSGRLEPRVSRIEPGAGTGPDHARADAVAQARGGEAGAAVVEDTHQAALGEAALGGVLGMQRDRLTALDLGRAGMRAVIELAVQFVGGLVRRSAVLPPSHSIGSSQAACGGQSS
jgi:hypothetical protein